MLKLIKSAKEYIPKVKEIEEFRPTGKYEGIRAITYDAPKAFQRKYKTFAYIGFPKAEGKVPAVVLVHGGSGHAYLEWVKMWNNRGYAAIAMDLEGYYPLEVNSGAEWTYGSWVHGEYGVFDEGEEASPKNDAMESFDKPFESQWMMHAVTKVITAHNILKTYNNIEKIGICGVSWGGVITSIVIGYDTDFDFAVPIYGSGYLDMSLASLGKCFQVEKTKKNWLAQNNFEKLIMPCLWLCWNDDTSFSINSNSMSYKATKPLNALTRLSIVNNMKHSQNAAAVREEPYIFADIICKNGKPFAEFETQPDTKEFECNIIYADSIKGAEIYYIDEPMSYTVFNKFGAGEHSYMKQNWEIVPCNIKGSKISGVVPDKASNYYVGVTVESEGKEYIVTSMLF